MFASCAINCRDRDAGCIRAAAGGWPDDIEALSDWNCAGTMESHPRPAQIGSLCGARNFAVANLPMSHKILHG